MAIDRIQGPGGPQRPESAAQAGTRPAPRRSAESPSPRPEDRIELSDAAREAARLAAKAAELPDVRVEKVERLREAIQDGTYAVDPRTVARAIVEFEGDLFGR